MDRCKDELLITQLAVVAAAGAVLLFKDAVRPLTGDLTLMLVLTLLLSAVAGMRVLLETQRRATTIGLGIAAGLLAAAVGFSGEVPVLTSGLSAAPSRLYHDAVTTVHPSTAVRVAQQQRFGWSHFTQFPTEIRLARSIKSQIGNSSSNLFVLGDDPIEYVLLDQTPPWDTNVYNMSPIRDQQLVEAWIARHQPAVAVLDLKDGQTFDGVPDDVRVPLVYQQIVRRYEPERTLSGFVVLRRRRPGEAPAASFWVGQLGSVLDLGAIPDAEAPIPSAHAGGEATSVLQVRTRSGVTTGETVSVPLSFGGAHVTVEFQALKGRRTYDIPLDRLWPWALSHRVTPSGPPSTGWSANIVSGSMPTNRLY